LGCMPRSDELILPERHLGLVQATENKDISHFIERAAQIASENLDLEALFKTARSLPQTQAPKPHINQPRTISIAADTAFAFCYPHIMKQWQKSGAKLHFFSPLRDEAPQHDSDFIYLPGGYPELHASTLADAHKFKDALRSAADAGVAIYGECGGYMALGQTLTDRAGISHEMAGLLPIHTSFEKPKRHLGYRQASLISDCVLGAAGTQFSAHEFHYASVVGDEGHDPIFEIENASGQKLGTVGARNGSVAGSYIHLINGALAHLPEDHAQ
jgi:cobyrinic acid a,c-diamide synthase